MLNKSDLPQKSLRYYLTTRRYLVIAIGLSAASVLLFFWLIFPKIQLIQQHRAEMAKETKKLEDLEKKNDLLANADAIEAYAQRSRINAILPSFKPLLPTIQRVEALSGQTGVIVSSFVVSPGELASESGQLKVRSTQAKQSTKNTEGIDFQLTVVGKIDQVNQFLRGVDQLAPFTEVSSISLSKVNRRLVVNDQEESLTEVFEADILLETYFYVGQANKSLTVLPDLSKIDQNTLAQLAEYVVSPSQTQPVPTSVQGGGKINLFE